MSIQSPSLGDRFAGLRAAAEADLAPGHHSASLHALILSCLAALFARLEQFFLQWQSGTLPTPQAPQPRPAHARPDAAAPSSPATPRTGSRTQHRARARTPITLITTAARATHFVAAITPFTSTPPPPPQHPARPPPVRAEILIQ